MTKDHSIWTKLDRFPPILVRLLAVANHASYTSDAQISQVSGLPFQRVKALNWTPTWDGVTLTEMRRFTEACGIDFTNAAQMRQLTRYLKNNPQFAKLKKHPQYPEYLERLRYLYDHSTSSK